MLLPPLTPHHSTHRMMAAQRALPELGMYATLRVLVFDSCVLAVLIGSRDNCPTVKNKRQRDLDKDGLGNACDLDGESRAHKSPIMIAIYTSTPPKHILVG